MAAIPWRKEFETGDPAVDHEHREMIGLINRMIDYLASAGTPLPGQPDQDALLGEAYAQISAHFALEESLMRNSRYPAFQEHKADHDRLLDEIREIMDSHGRGDYRDRRDAFSREIEAWFVVHFRTHDAKLHSVLRT